MFCMILPPKNAPQGPPGQPDQESQAVKPKTRIAISWRRKLDFWTRRSPKILKITHRLGR